ncbi:insulinase family protein [Microaerobacter geothermalis]|uniref:EF-P 5-aminopentanol modification-associated protein YfmH n=1 Tax=Microaerobacter geothermalis TaxID=674972 RepID=UPI001F3FBD7C|nr:pitrilysin family protein [Microaerobacter geothermalis]MCF6093161.1 insulinase family protein [Microaerobacter geothermalis]
MKEITFDQLKETLYFEKLDNGLSVYILPKEGFNKTYATFTTKYGSIDNHFRPPGGEELRVPDGIAHFLEHKMFEEEDGDVFQKFSSNGASANAFTSFERTAYLFSCTDHLETNLTTLIDFVQHPYFTDENVEKEKGIIAQEIRMYEDNPDWRSYFGLIQNMYHQHPVRIDIAGTIESISKITKETLYQCYETFYHPSNMLLFVVGSVEPKKIMNLVIQNQNRKDFKNSLERIERFYPNEPQSVKSKRSEVKLSVGIPKCLFGFKEKRNNLTGEALLKRELSTKLLLDILLGPSSILYQQLYDEDIINDTFGSDYSCEQQYAFSVVGGDTKDPDKLLQKVEESLKKRKEEGISEDEFERARRKKIGGFLKALNSPEFIANQFTRYRFIDSDLFHIVPVLEDLNLEDVNQRLQEHIDFEQMAVSIVSSTEK